MLLRNSGQYAWARREFESILAENENRAEGFIRLNPGRHAASNKSKDLEAAAALEKIVKAVEAQKGDGRTCCKLATPGRSLPNDSII